MLHLSTERLAALAAEAPSAIESEHLAVCAACAGERAAHAAVLRMAADERAHLAPPLTTWSSIAARLREEKLVVAPSRARLTAWGRGWIRAAAAVLLVAGGVAIGRASAGETLLTGAAGPEAAGTVEFASEDEAWQALERAQVAVQNALVYLAAREDSILPATPAPEDMRARLAALDEVGMTTSRALALQPLDPVLNSYHMQTLGYREATLRQLDAALPAGVRLTSW